MFSSRKIILWIVLLFTLCIAAYVLLVYIPQRIAQQAYDGAKQIGKDISDAFQFTPEVRVNNTVVLQQQTPIFELATLSQKFRHEYEWVNTWLNSTKKIKITGTFEAKAGFDLHQHVRVDIIETHAIVTLPLPQLLSLEPAADYTFEDENGIWNWVDHEDRSKALNAFTQDARKYADQAGFISQAKEAVEERMKTIFESHGMSVEIRYDNDIPDSKFQIPD